MTAPLKYGADTAAFLGDGRDEEAEAERWLVPGVVPVGMPTMIFGKPKSKKSLLAYHIAIGVAAGVPVLGQPTQRGRVLVISREDGEHETRRRLWQMARGLGVDLVQLCTDGWLLVDAKNPLYLDRPADVARLDATMREFRPSLVVIDSLSRVNTADEDRRGSMSAVTNAWSDLCATYDCTVVLLHHELKGDGGGRLDLDRVRGTGDLAAVLRVAIRVKAVDERKSRIDVAGNIANMSGPITFTISDGVDAAGMKLIAVTTDDAGRAAKLAAAQPAVTKENHEAAAKMLAFAEASEKPGEEGATREELYPEAGVPQNVARAIVDDLVKSGALVYIARAKPRSTYPKLWPRAKAEAGGIAYGSRDEMRARLMYGEASS